MELGMLEYARNVVREADIETRPRLWLHVAFVMMAMKIAVTLYFVAEMRGAVPKPAYPALLTLSWISSQRSFSIATTST
jgi:NADH:ubiquinone oxidoreductase subunit H